MHCTQLRLNIGGNYILHDPKDPDLSVATKSIIEPTSLVKGKEGPGRAHPRVIREARSSLTHFYNNPGCWPIMNNVVALSNNKELGCKGKNARQMRSESREAVIRLGLVLLQHCDLASMRVGVQTPEGFLPYGVKYLARMARMSVRRCERVLRKYSSGEYLTTRQRSSVDESGQYKGEVAIRLVSKELFIALGVSANRFDAARNAAYQRVKAMTRRKVALVESLMQAMTRRPQPRQGRLFKITPRKWIPDQENKITKVAQALMESNPTLTLDAARAEAAVALNLRV